MASTPSTTPTASGDKPGARWTDLRNGVRESRRQLALAAVRVPTNFAFRRCQVQDNDKLEPVTRIYFLATTQFGRDNTLMYVDVPDEVAGSEVHQYGWNSLIESTFQPTTAQAKVSKEEQLMLERKRLSWSWGISTYDLDAPSGKFVFPSAGSLYGCFDNTKGLPSSIVPPILAAPSSPSSSASSVIPLELSTTTEGARLNATICPTNPSLVAFFCNGDIWVHNTLTDQEVRLTHCQQADVTSSSTASPISAGLPAYIIQEEFKRFEGFWWRPQWQNGTYSILYEEVDESDVDVIKFPTSMTGDVEEFRFPKAGTPNANCVLKMVRFRLNTSGEICNVERLELRTPLEAVIPWMEYLVRAGWTPDGKYAWVQVLDRRQQVLQLVLLPYDHFVPISDGHENGLGSQGIRNGGGQLLPAYRVICTVRSETWINVTDILEFFPSDDLNHIRFIWASEASGWRHLYLITAQLVHVTPEMTHDEYTDCFLRPHILSQVALTSGQWSVLDRQVKVDWSSGLVYFHGLKDTPLEKHLYVVSMQQPGAVKRLTPAGYSHNTCLDDACSHFVTVFSSIQSPPACQIYRLNHLDSTAEGVVPESLGWILPPTVLDKSYQHPELFCHVISSGDVLYGMMFKPHDMQPGVRYPVLLNIYGGPEVQLVSNSFKGMRQMRSHMLASQGYCVISIDSRGSHYRGVAFESHLRLKMGQLELADQVEFLTWLGSVTDYLDMERVAIHGWSYGGYLSLMALVQYPDVFKVAIAGAPVTDWNLYDTAYTERYMDLPANNPAGYSLGSVLNYGNDFPDEPNRLLIVHGIMDENVHFFQHTTQLLALLIRCGKPYQLQIYPNERHSLRRLDATEHFETTLLSFLKSNL